MDMLTRMQTGRFKVFKHLNDWFEEFRLYHRKDGKVVKEYDDLMAATRYGVMMLRNATTDGCSQEFQPRHRISQIVGGLMTKRRFVTWNTLKCDTAADRGPLSMNAQQRATASNYLMRCSTQANTDTN